MIALCGDRPERGGGRKADQWLRDQGIPPGTVQASNSLQEAALVQGIMFAVRLRERYQGVLITEAHPKALLPLAALKAERASLAAVSRRKSDLHQAAGEAG